MKRQYFCLLILFALLLPGTGGTQDKVAALDELTIELWPDYDRASVLVLLTGTLPPNTLLPATVALPLPETAQVNAVARIDSSDGKMKDDIFSSRSSSQITFGTPDLRFRLEYYLPYVVNDNQRTFDFSWLADLSVDRLLLKVQQPTSASSLSTKPATTDVTRDEDGFTYHAFPAQPVPAGQSFSVHVAYTMPGAQLSAESLAPSSTGVEEPGSPSTFKTGAGINWPAVAVVGGGIIIVMVFVWRIATYRAAATQPEPVPQPTKGKEQSRSKFCRNCGKPMGEDDKFCSKCGSARNGKKP